MWVRILPADPAAAVTDTELKGNWSEISRQMRHILHGDIELVKTQALGDKFGMAKHLNAPAVVMLVNETGNMVGTKLPINKKASQYYPNDYDIFIRGNAILVGYELVDSGDPEEGPGPDLVDFPEKWRIINQMEETLERKGDDVWYVQQEFLRLALRALAISDHEEVYKMYQEARDHYNKETEWPL